MCFVNYLSNFSFVERSFQLSRLSTWDEQPSGTLRSNMSRISRRICSGVFAFCSSECARVGLLFFFAYLRFSRTPLDRPSSRRSGGGFQRRPRPEIVSSQFWYVKLKIDANLSTPTLSTLPRDLLVVCHLYS